MKDHCGALTCLAIALASALGAGRGIAKEMRRLAELTISIAMATFNGAAYLREQLQSIAAQSRLPDELVVNDDCSTDGTMAILEAFAAAAPFPVILERNAENLGTIRNFERSVARCSGDIIALADQDDVWLEDKLKLIGARFESDPAVGLVFSDATLVDQALTPLGSTLWQSLGLDRKRIERLRARPLAEQIGESAVTGATMAFRRDYRGVALPIPTDLAFYLHDRWIATVVSAFAPVEAIERPLILYRQHRRQQVGARGPKRIDRLKALIVGERPFVEIETKALAALLSRIRESGLDANPIALEALTARLEHMRRRLALPPSRIRRIGPVLGELRSGRYGLDRRGPISALKDLIL